MLRADASKVSSERIRWRFLWWTFQEFVTDSAGSRVVCDGCNSRDEHPHYVTRSVRSWLWPSTSA